MTRLAACLMVPVLPALVACSSAPAGDGRCAGNADCASGEVCSQGDCLQVCATDFDCEGGDICRDSLCSAGSRQQPRITAIDGDGADTCIDHPEVSTGHRCVGDGVVIEGENLEGAAFNLVGGDGGAGSQLQASDGASDILAALSLPQGIAPGRYTLSASNGAGTAEQTFDLIAGPPGPTLAADPLIDHINGATSSTFELHVLPVGIAANQVARGDHLHPEYVPIEGGTITGSLAIGGNLDLTGIHQPAGAAATTYVYSARRWVLDLSPAQVGVVQAIDRPLMEALCRDLDGCSVTFAMINWDGTGTIGSRRVFMFWSPQNNRWRFSSDLDATDADGSANNQEYCEWDCCVTDAETSTGNDNNRVDNLVGFGILNLNGGNYNDSNTSCRFIFED